MHLKASVYQGHRILWRHISMYKIANFVLHLPCGDVTFNISNYRQINCPLYFNETVRPKWLLNRIPCIVGDLILSFFTFSVSRSRRAGLCFPVSRTQNSLRKGRYSKLIGKSSPIYLAAVLEYLTAEVLELAGNYTRENKRHRITPRFINMAVRSDEELHTLLKDITVSEGGVMPFIHSVLLPKKSAQRTSTPSER